MKVDTQDGEISEWNEAVFKMKRLHELQTEMNLVKMSPLKRHHAIGSWNYEIWFKTVVSLYFEGRAKYDTIQQKEVNEIKKIIEQFMVSFPVYKNVKKVSYSCENKTNQKFNQENWLKLEKLIELLECKVKYYNDKHGLSTKNKESQDGRSILR